MSGTELGVTVRTGEQCPASGVWKVIDTPTTTAKKIAEGTKMPPFEGEEVTWKLIQLARPEDLARSGWFE